MREYTKFYITPKGERAARSGHPWVYAEEITRIEGEYQNGDLVDVVTNKGKYPVSYTHLTLPTKA